MTTRSLLTRTNRLEERKDDDRAGDRVSCIVISGHSEIGPVIRAFVGREPGCGVFERVRLDQLVTGSGHKTVNA